METTKRTKSEENRDQYTVVLEDLRSQFKVFGEGLQAVRKKGDETFEAVGELKEDVAVLKEDMQEVKEELHLIRNELKEKVSRDEFLALEHRVSRLEKSARAA